MALEKPASIKSSPFKSSKWDELTQGRNFSTSDIPALELLCAWYEVAATCIDDISVADGVQVVWLPVEMALLQNRRELLNFQLKFDYQSKWHCSKTQLMERWTAWEFDYQSKWHCSKTAMKGLQSSSMFDYQSKWHCSKTFMTISTMFPLFDYQSKWHCSKTLRAPLRRTSKFDYQSKWHCSKTRYT